MRFEVTLTLSLGQVQVALDMYGPRLGVNGLEAEPKAFSRSLLSGGRKQVGL